LYLDGVTISFLVKAPDKLRPAGDRSEALLPLSGVMCPIFWQRAHRVKDAVYRSKLHLPKDYFVTAPPPPPGEFVVSPLDPSSERGPCAPPRGPFLKICFFRYTRLHTSRVRALETASFTLEGAAATCEETAMDETMVVLLTHGARQVERALRRALHCPQQHSKLPAPHLLALVP
jgi:hypothetical protein